MTPVWSALTGLQEHIINEFNVFGKEYHEPGMERYNQPGWINRHWKSERFRLAHISVVDARETKKLLMMHVCVFPHVTNDAPIFGFDVVAGPNKITGAFHDFSPTTNFDHPLVKFFTSATQCYNWGKKRDLPEWAKQIFSDDMVAAGNVQSEEELEQLDEMVRYNLYTYLSKVGLSNSSCIADFGHGAQNMYAYYQKQNPHTPRVMKSLGLPEQDVDSFISECLFPQV